MYNFICVMERYILYFIIYKSFFILIFLKCFLLLLIDNCVLICIFFLNMFNKICRIDISCMEENFRDISGVF